MGHSAPAARRTHSDGCRQSLCPPLAFLSLATNPKGSDESRRCKAWLAELVAAGVQIMVPEGADYEVRRELIRAGRRGGLDRLDNLARKAGFGLPGISANAGKRPSPSKKAHKSRDARTKKRKSPVSFRLRRRFGGRRPGMRAMRRPMTRRWTAT